MALRSQMLQDDRALQACLVNDKDHVVPGASGPHVAKIQSALLLLDKSLNLPVDELRAKRYGPSTADAVLAFKRKRRIINLAYQTSPDNIVGKMTIAQLDSELETHEQRPSPARVVCRGTSESIVSSAGSSSSFGLVGGPRTSNPRSPAPVMTFRRASIAVVFQETDAAVEAGGGVRLLFGQFQKAREMMAPFGLDFAGAAVGGVFPLIGPRIPDSEQVISGSPVSTFSVRAAAERVLPGQPSVLRVIFCPFSVKDERTFGVTDGGQVSEWNFPKFCLINVRKANPDQGTLLHEILHAARPEKQEHDADPTSVFSENIGGRSKLPPAHAEAVAHAFFSTILL